MNARRPSLHRMAGTYLLYGAVLLLCVPFTAWAEPAQKHPALDQPSALSHPVASWAEQLKGQTVLEDVLEGRPERAAMVERQHERIMVQLDHDAAMQHTSGRYNNMSMMHQYGAGGQDLLLMSDQRTEPVAREGGRCPAQAPVHS